MSSTAEIIAKLKQDWTTPRAAVHHGAPSPFSLQCEFDAPATTDEIDSVNIDIPDALHSFWSQSQSAELFKDAEYGQWGLRILAPKDATHATTDYQQGRRRDAVVGDLVVAEFFGDSDLVIVRCDKSAEDFGAVIVALPLDNRSNWERVGNNFEDFLERYMKADGDKFWENQ